MTLKLLTKHHLEFLRLKGGCTDSSESTLVKMQHCWKSHVRAHIVFLISLLKHAVDTQKKRLNETFLLSTINIQCVNEIYFSYFSTKTYSVGTQKNCLNEAVLLSPLTYKMKLILVIFTWTMVLGWVCFHGAWLGNTWFWTSTVFIVVTLTVLTNIFIQVPGSLRTQSWW